MVYYHSGASITAIIGACAQLIVWLVLEISSKLAFFEADTEMIYGPQNMDQGGANIPRRCMAFFLLILYTL